jgi:hypothetical protein
VRYPKHRLGASEIVAEFLNKTQNEGSYEISSFDCDICGIHQHGDSDVARGWLLQGQRKMLPEPVL